MPTDVDDVTGLGPLSIVVEPTRWRIVQMLAREELCVCHLVEELGLPQPLVSHHLRALRDAELVETSRHRYWTYYRLRPESLRRIADELRLLVKHAPPPGKARRPCC